MEGAQQDNPQAANSHNDVEGPPAKRPRIDDRDGTLVDTVSGTKRIKERGHALIKEEYIIDVSSKPATAVPRAPEPDDDAAEGRTAAPDNASVGGANAEKPKWDKKKKGPKGQNKDRQFGSSSDTLRLCNSYAHTDEFSPRPCKFGDRCNALHDIRKYLAEGRRADLQVETWNECPGIKAFGKCQSGWRCRFVKSHSQEVMRDDGRKELVLLGGLDQKTQENGQEKEADPETKEEEGRKGAQGEAHDDWADDRAPDVANIVPNSVKIDLQRKRLRQEKSEIYLKWLKDEVDTIHKFHNRSRTERDEEGEDREELRANFVDPPLKPSEKRRLYFGRGTPVLAPLTTQGNLPFRRLCVELGAEGTYSEMALAQDLVQGKKSEWALLKVHESELAPPKFDTSKGAVVQDYDNTKDLKFGAQIAASHPWQATKAAELMTTYLPHLRLIDLNCGCPIDLVYRQGAGSGLLDTPNKIDRLVRGMNTVSGDVPITVKLRMGVQQAKPNALGNIEKIAFGSFESSRLGAPGAAAITLHGRSRQQRYKHSADWGYIAQCSALIKSYREKRDELTDTAKEPDPSTQATAQANGEAMYFLGNGDCYSHTEYFDHVDNAGVDTVMIARGALLKPWLFEEIEKGQYLDKTATERLSYVEKFARYGMECWGTDELGIGITRRFMLEYLSFAHRYVPVGLLDYLPPALNDRPPAYRCRNELETLLASGNYKDWIKISEMFLGPAHPNFRFEPKHKSNAYEIEAEG